MISFSKPPFSYEEYNLGTSLVTPSTVHVTNTGLSLFFQRYFFQRAISVFKWRIPKWWAKNYLLACIYMWGYVAVVNTDKFGVIPQGAGLGGYNVFYQPTKAIISNPLIRGTLEPRIGEQCEIIKLSPDYRGIYDIIAYYGDQMALAAQAFGVNMVNSHLAFVFNADNKSAAESYKKMFDQIAEGNPAVVIDKHLFNDDGSQRWGMAQQNLGQNHIAGQLLDELRTIQNMFDTEIGIPNSNTTKRERLIQDEVNSNNIETFSKSALWLETLKESIQRVNEMFGLDIAVDWRFTPQEVVGDG